MPTSINPPPKEDEVECGNCGAYVYHDLLKCPNCGVYLVEPNEPEEERPQFQPPSKLSLMIDNIKRKIRGEPHVAEELFTGAMRVASLFDDLLKKVGGDRLTVERLIEYEKQLSPRKTRLVHLQTAIRRWERENS